MQVTYQLTAEDYRHALVTYRNRNFSSKWGLPLLLGFAILLVLLEIWSLFTTPDPSWLWKALPLTIAYAGLLGFIYWKGLSISANRQFRNTPSAKGPITLDVSDAGLHYRSSTTDSTESWNSYIKWMEDKAVFALFPAPKMFIVIPKRAFSPEQLERFCGMLRQNIQK